MLHGCGKAFTQSAKLQNRGTGGMRWKTGSEGEWECPREEGCQAGMQCCTQQKERQLDATAEDGRNKTNQRAGEACIFGTAVGAAQGRRHEPAPAQPSCTTTGGQVGWRKLEGEVQERCDAGMVRGPLRARDFYSNGGCCWYCCCRCCLRSGGAMLPCCCCGSSEWCTWEVQTLGPLALAACRMCRQRVLRLGCSVLSCCAAA